MPSDTEPNALEHKCVFCQREFESQQALDDHLDVCPLTAVGVVS